MKWYTHVVFALLISLLLKFNFFMVLICLFGSLLPDIDSPKSLIGWIFRPLSNFFELIFGHRGIFHSLFFAILLSGVIWMFSHRFALAFFIGYLSHLLIDGFTRQGVRLFYPFKARLKGFCKTGGIFEYVLLLVLVVLIIIVTTVTSAGKVFINVF